MSRSSVSRLSSHFSSPAFAAAAAALVATCAVGGGNTSPKSSSFILYPAESNLVRPMDPTCCTPLPRHRPPTQMNDSFRFSLPATFSTSTISTLLPTSSLRLAPHFLPDSLFLPPQYLGGTSDRPAYRLILPASSNHNRIRDTNVTSLFSVPSASLQPPPSPLTPPLPSPSTSTPPSSSIHTWHYPSPGVKPLQADLEPSLGDGKGGGGLREGVPGGGATVVLLGWLGAKQRNLRRYADFYNGHGIHAVTFVVPMRDLVASFKIGQRAEEHVDSLVNELERWLDLQTIDIASGNPPRTLIFHTFSNTGWLVYGAVLKRLHAKFGRDAVEGLIKGCVVDSAPAPNPTPQVWAAGFCTALMSKKKLPLTPTPPLTQEIEGGGEGGVGGMGWLGGGQGRGEAALLAVLEKFFSVFLNLPVVKDKLEEVVSVLREEQPKCPQLYIYSNSDVVIPASEIEAFMGEQERLGHVVIARKLEGSPHVEHFKTFPEVYMGQLRKFLGHCLPHWKFGAEESFGTSPDSRAGA